MTNNKETIEMHNLAINSDLASPQNDFKSSTTTISTITISNAGINDAHDLCAIHKTTRYKTDNGYNGEYAKATRNCGYYENFWSNAFEDEERIILKAEQDGVILGFISVGKSPFPTDFGIVAPEAAERTYKKIHNNNPKLGELQQIYVMPEQHGKGVGAALYHAGAKALAENGYESMLVNVIRENDNARKFYERMGGNNYGTIREDIQRDEETYCVFCTLYVDDKIDRFLDKKQELYVRHTPI